MLSVCYLVWEYLCAAKFRRGCQLWGRGDAVWLMAYVAEMGLKLPTWNVRGLGESSKVRKVFSYRRQHDISIATLQEMHLTTHKQTRLRDGWMGEGGLSMYSAYARGMAILVYKGLQW